jgi:hypothetical protein
MLGEVPGMTGVEVILAAGVGAGTSDAAKTAVADAYTGLRGALRRRLAGRLRAEQMLDATETELGKWQADLAIDLEEFGAAHDEEILAGARRMLTRTDAAGSSAGKYQVGAREAKGMQIGDHTTQHNTFS